MNKKTQQLIYVVGVILSLGELLFGVVIMDNDPCSDQTILINLPFWFILKGCITLNLIVFLYVYGWGYYHNVALVSVMWISLVLHLAWVVVGCDFIWNKCLDKYHEDSIHSALWLSVILGMILFITSVIIVVLSHEKKKREYHTLIY
jgi:hypothetical protein